MISHFPFPFHVRILLGLYLYFISSYHRRDTAYGIISGILDWIQGHYWKAPAVLYWTNQFTSSNLLNGEFISNSLTTVIVTYC